MLHVKVKLISHVRCEFEGLPPQEPDVVAAWRMYIGEPHCSATLPVYATTKNQYAPDEELTGDYGNGYERDYSTGE